ncbi:MAG: radical SAM protein [Nitrospirae bacterium]|nr:radical SAM protein [Nitrospirota bacterium]
MNLKQFSPMKILNHLALAKAIVNGENPYPPSFEIDPTNMCNHNCIWCMYDDFLKQEKVFIPNEIFKSIIDEIIDIKTMSVTFTGGGDPLSHPKTIEMLPYIKSKDISVAIITNGGNLNSAKCEIIVENCSYIRISIDAGCEVTHRKLHMPTNKDNDNFTKIINNIHTMVELKRKLNKDVVIGIGYLVHPENTQEIFSIISKMKEIGVNYVQIRPVCNLKKEDRDIIAKDAHRQIYHSLRLVSDDFKVFPILHRFDEIMSIDRGYEICYGHGLVGIIGADCNVYLCCQLKGNKDFILGNLREKSFKDIWFGSKRKEIIKNININKCPPCRYTKYNEILEYLADKDNFHSEFL